MLGQGVENLGVHGPVLTRGKGRLYPTPEAEPENPVLAAMAKLSQEIAALSGAIQAHNAARETP